MGTTIVMLLVASLTCELAGCAKSGDEKLADRVENYADAQADALEDIDAAKPNPAAMSNEQEALIVNGAAPVVG